MTKGKVEVTINKIWLGDDLGTLADDLTADGFMPASLVIIGFAGNTVRIRHNCHNLAELVGILTVSLETVGINRDA